MPLAGSVPWLLGEENDMELSIFADKVEMGRAAAKAGAQLIRQAIAERRRATIIVATGASQFEMLDALVAEDGIDWSKVTGFHLDEYVGLPISHPASFRQYLWKRFVSRLPLPLRHFHFLNGEREVASECARVGESLSARTVDVAFVGIGENAHLAFNDPPANFDTRTPYLVVDLDEACRRQQLGEGWFPDLESVPQKAISMSVREILRAKTIICTVPDARKAKAVKASLEGPITPDVPASILQEHRDCRVFLDVPAAGLLSQP
jgi:glucosamine-6-phosphate deaminase